MKLGKILATGALALSLAAPAFANQVVATAPRVWVWIKMVPTPNEAGQPAIVYGMDNYPTLAQCKAAIRDQAADDTIHFDYCAKFNQFQAGQDGQ